MVKIDRAHILDTTKKIGLRALLPNFLLVLFLILLHWIIISIWFYYNHDKQTIWTSLILGLLGGSFTVLTYFLWGLRRFFIKGYLIIHHEIIQLWLQPFCKKMSDRVLHSEALSVLDLKEGSLVKELKDYFTEKTQAAPKIIQKILRRVIRKLGYSDTLERNIKLIITKDSDQIANLIHEEIGNQLILASNRVVSRKIIYLIPINTVLMILLWLI